MLKANLIYLNGLHGLELFNNKVFEIDYNLEIFFVYPRYLNLTMFSSLARRIKNTFNKPVFFFRREEQSILDITKAFQIESLIVPLVTNYEIPKIIDTYKNAKVIAYEESLLSYNPNIIETFSRLDYIHASNYLDIFKIKNDKFLKAKFKKIDFSDFSNLTKDNFLEEKILNIPNNSIIFLDPYYSQNYQLYKEYSLKDELFLLKILYFCLKKLNKNVFIKWHPRRESSCKFHNLDIEIIPGNFSIDELVRLCNNCIFTGFTSASLFHLYHHYRTPIIHLSLDILLNFRLKHKLVAKEVEKEEKLARDIFISLNEILDNISEKLNYNFIVTYTEEKLKLINKKEN
ncbi:hypothetical protein C3H49_02715 [Campylobacter jejuni]|uniref:hypothetical protein n=1 Tax=Campylobacter jejuni TaxID=197 RepID=UPI000F808062|nr:hypothetical protein [Campylobacter jejuni]RTJ88849.1 hypothetical protein C3H49_02715 [Campylobacter jejuni]